MATLRHGEPVNMSGWLDKEGKYFKTRYRRYLKLKGSILSNHHNEESPATWEVNVCDCAVSDGNRTHELIISLPQRKVSFFAPSRDDYSKWARALKIASSRTVGDFYTMGRVLGEGAFAQVRIATDNETGERFAVKVLDKARFDDAEKGFLLKEINILKSVRHEHITEVYDLFDTKSTMYIVMEFMEGGELFDIIADAGHFSEKQASEVTKKVLIAVAYLHENGIVHRDIKPENVLCKTKKWPLDVKLADFGLANFAEDGEVEENNMTTMIGTPGYVAPEVVKREKYGAPVDMWAVGVILYIMLSGKMPFYGRDDVECLRRIALGKYSFPKAEWSKVSPEASSLVKALLQLDPDKRLTARAALQHPWLTDVDHLSSKPIDNDLTGIHSTRRKFRKAVMAAVTIERIKGLAAGNALAAAAKQAAT